MKNILLSAYTCCPNKGSEPGNGWNWIMGYIHNDFAVHCVTSSKYKQEIKTFCSVHNLRNLNFYFTDSKSSLYLLKIPVIGIYLHYYAWLLKSRTVIKKIIREISFLHAHHVTYSSIKFGTPLYNTGLKVILGPLGGGTLPHPSLKKFMGYHYYLEFFKNTLGHFLSVVNPTVSKSIKNADLILVSNDIAANIIKRYSSKKPLRMFDAGLSDYFENSFLLRPIKDVINIVWIGRMLPRKGLNLAIEALSHLPKNLNFHFYIIGDGPLKTKAEQMIHNLKLDGKTTFLGRLPHDELKSVLQTSHLMLFPSLIDSCPMQVFEAMAYGLPIVTLDHQGMKEQVIEGTGSKIPVNNSIDYPKKLAEAISQIVKNQEIYNSYSHKAWQFGQKQFWNIRIKKFLEEYKVQHEVSL